MDRIVTIQAFGDNYIYLCQYDEHHGFAVDPCESTGILDILQERQLDLKLILATHHHWDHVGAVAELKGHAGCRVIGCDKRRIPGIDSVVADGQIIEVGDDKVQVIATPGHTRTSACYYMLPSRATGPGILWTGDTLFVAGCGRLLECDAQTMWDSLQKLASLPDDTLIYCGHNYTVEDLEFALSIEPDNQAVRQQLRQAIRMQEEGDPTVPSTMAQEKKTNPFLRSDTPEVKNALKIPDAQAVDVFAELRRRKDFF
ncbi:MAG: hydroxyacylglutathione hydrolase [Phycisphaerales bacterium]|nr:MAG: hydroxyacylglutathione hydrolase [Phycisphaerales bacterium]